TITIHKNSNNPTPALWTIFGNNFSQTMKRVLLVYAVLFISIIAWYLTEGKGKRILSDFKGTALQVSKHSQGFNASMEAVMENYYKMVDDFTRADTASIDKNANQL